MEYIDKYTYTIYQIKNTRNNNMRLGHVVADQLEKRWSWYRASLRNHTYNKKILKQFQMDWDTFGESAFEFNILEENVNIKNVTDREDYWINHFGWDMCIYNDNKPRSPKKVRSPLEQEEYRLKRSTVTKGSRNGNSTINEKTAGQILFMLNHSDLTKAQIATIFDVTISIVNNIYYGKRWVDVEPLMPIIKRN